MIFSSSVPSSLPLRWPRSLNLSLKKRIIEFFDNSPLIRCIQQIIIHKRLRDLYMHWTQVLKKTRLLIVSEFRTIWCILLRVLRIYGHFVCYMLPWERMAKRGRSKKKCSRKVLEKCLPFTVNTPKRQVQFRIPCGKYELHIGTFCCKLVWLKLESTTRKTHLQIR